MRGEVKEVWNFSITTLTCIRMMNSYKIRCPRKDFQLKPLKQTSKLFDNDPGCYNRQLLFIQRPLQSLAHLIRT